MDVGRATKSFGRNADDEELATIYEYLTHLPQFLIRAPVALRNSARRSCRKGVRGSGQPTSAALPHPQCNIAVERERSHDVRHRWLVSYEGDANAPSETPSQQSRDNRRKRRAAPSGELDTLGHQSPTGL